MRWLLELSFSLMANRQPLRLVLLREYTDRDRIVNFEPASAEKLLTTHAAEAYAIVPAGGKAVIDEDIKRALAHPHYADESALCHCFADQLVGFLHDGHCSVEIIGPTHEVMRCLVHITELGEDKGFAPSNLREEDMNELNH